VRFHNRLFTARLTSGKFRELGSGFAWSGSTRNCGIADVDGDQRSDLVCLDGGKIMTVRSRGNGSFLTSTTGLSGTYVADTPMALGDFDADGLADVALAPAAGSKRSIVTLTSLGTGTYSAETQSTPWQVESDHALRTADADGDGVSDLVLVRTGAAGGGGIALSVKGHGAPGRFLPTVFAVPWKDAVAADVNGDGRTDLVSTETFEASISLGGGFFAAPTAGFTVSGTCGAPFIGDTDGDGRTDLICVKTTVATPTTPRTMTVRDVAPLAPLRDPHKWISADLDGDGQADYAYVYARNPGVGVLSILTSGPAAPSRVTWTLAPSATIPGLTDPSANRWLAADVGGPTGAADGKADLVLVDADAGSLRMYTLLSNGDGSYAATTDQPWRDAAGNLLAFPEADLGNFFPLDLDSDGRDDLIRLSAQGSAARVAALRSRGDGKWERRDTIYAFPGGATLASPTDLRPIDLNGDGLVDLVHTQTGVGISGTEVRALLSRGDTTFTPVRSNLAMTFADVARWMLLDANGDGLDDLVHVESTVSATGSGIAFQPVLSRGDGTFTVETATTAWLDATGNPALAKGLEGSAFLYPTDLDGDGRTDLYALSRYRDAAGIARTLIVQLRNPGLGGAAWTVSAFTPGAALPAAAAWAWRPTRDSSRPSSSGLAHLDPSVGAAVFYDRPTDRLVRIENGTGGVIDVAYKPLLGHRAYLPSGTLPIVTDVVTRTDLAYAPAAVEQVTYGYDGARWSDAERRMIGYAAIGARDPRRYVVTGYTTDDACPTMIAHTTTYDAVTDEVYSYTANGFVAPGAAAPYTCLLQQQSQYGCDGGSCRRESLAELYYDAYGNVVSRLDTAVDAPTRGTFTPVIPNLVDYVVDLPQYRKIVEQGTSGPIGLSETVFLYDNASSVQPPAATAELTGVQVWDDVDGVYRTTVLDYDAHGMLISSTTPGGVTTTTLYDPTYGSFPWVVCNPVGCTTTSWDMGLGLPVITWDYNGHGTLTARDAHGRVHQVTSADGSVVRYTLLNHGVVWGSTSHRQRMRTEIVDGSPGDGVLWSEQLLDGTGRVYRTQSEAGAASVVEYDGLTSRVVRASLPFPIAGAPAHWTQTRYDALGRPLRATHADGTYREWIYTLGEVTATDELGHPRSLRLDGVGGVIRVTEHLDGVDHHTNYGYDALGRLIATVDAKGFVTRYDFDSRGLLRSETSPDRGRRSYRYTADGALRRSVDAKGQVIEIEYDAATGRPQTRYDRAEEGGDPERTVTWSYDALAGVPQGASVGRLVAIEEVASGVALATTYRYDGVGRVTHQRQCIAGTCMDFAWGYGTAGRLETITYPDASGAAGEVVDHRYDAAGRLVGVGPYVADIDYALDGRTDAILAGNGVLTQYVRDPQRRWADDLVVTHGSPLYRAHYDHDPTGRIEFLEEDAPTNTGTFDFDFDDLGRLERVAASDPALDRSYDYDAIGRMTFHSQLGSYQYDDPDHPHAMTSTGAGATRSYDQNGNATRVSDPSGRNFKIQWSVTDRPTLFDGSAGTYEMTYDVGGARVRKAGPTTGLYFGNLVAIEDGQFVKYYYAGSRLVARHDGKPFYYHQDHTNSPRLETDKDGLITNTFQYDAFGAPVVVNEPYEQRIGYAGVQGDEELGLVYLNARYYDPTTARFLSADSVVRDAFAPQSLDRYAYVEGDPINYWDPSGHMRRDIELMMERKQQWRTLMVAWEEAINGCGTGGRWCEPELTAMATYAPDGKVTLIRVPVGTDPASLRFDLTPTPDWPGSGGGGGGGGGEDWDQLDGPLAAGGPMMAGADGGVVGLDGPSGGVPDAPVAPAAGDGPQKIADNNPLPGQASDTGTGATGPVIVEVTPGQLKPGMNHITNVIMPNVTVTLDVMIGANGKVVGAPTITADGDTSTPTPTTKRQANEVSATITSNRERTVSGKEAVAGTQNTGSSATGEASLKIAAGVVEGGVGGSGSSTQSTERSSSAERGGELKVGPPSRRVIFQLPQSMMPKPAPKRDYLKEPNWQWVPGADRRRR
jgi:RHS repeat-associated protein